nr:MerR family transcriptional regulator [uncultured Cardiobacterium sp.]
MKIRELSARSGVHAETVRFYEKSGLLPPPQRAANGYRIYDEATLHALAFIKSCRALGFTLDDIRLLQRLKSHPAEHDRADALVAAQLQQVEEKIAQLMEIRAFLQSIVRVGAHEAADCPALGSLGG